jgi:NitT/TauT family transport system ATP-binding protein
MDTLQYTDECGESTLSSDEEITTPNVSSNIFTDSNTSTVNSKYDKSTSPILQLHDITISYSQDTLPVLHIDNLIFPKGSFTSLIGKSGCGKSTLLNCIAGLITPKEGVIDWCDSTNRTITVGMVFQEPALFPWMRVLDNVKIGLHSTSLTSREKNRLARDAINLVGLAGRERAFPCELSGGMKQRAVLARYLAAHCDLLLLDEPFSGLDQFAREEMQELLMQLYLDRGLTCIFVTHSIVEALYLGTRVVVLGGAPAGIVDIVEVDMPFPRPPESRLSMDGSLLREQLYQKLRLGK